MAANANYCRECGHPVALPFSDFSGESAAKPAYQSTNPFSKIKARSLILFAVVTAPMAAGLYLLEFGFEGEADPFLEAVLFDGWLYGVLAIWAFWQIAHWRVDLGRLVGTIPNHYGWLPLIGVVALLIFFSIGSFEIFLYWLAKTDSVALEFFAGDEAYVPSSYTDYPVLFNAEVSVVAIFVAPVVEEFIFRGMLFTRWSVKWGATPAILVSSLLFAIAHPDILGAFAFGVVMCLLYLRTRTLLVPMAAHAINNLLAVGFSAFTVSAAPDETASLVEELEAGLPFAIVVTVITTPILIWYVVRNWPRQQESAPYMLSSP